MKIAVDVDGVLLDAIEIFCSLYNEKHNTHYTHNNVQNWGFYEDWGISEKEFWKHFQEVAKHIEEYPPIDENIAGAVMFLLNRAHKVDILTNALAEPEKIKERLAEFDIRQGKEYEEFIKNTEKFDKAEQDYDIYVDDNPNLADKIIGTDKYLVLFRQNWNRNIKANNNILPVSNWMGVLRAIEKIVEIEDAYARYTP